MDHHVEIARHGGVLVLTLARPEKKNALTGAMYDALTAALVTADRDDDIGAVLFRGSGGSFSAGNDIGDFLAHARSGEAMPAFRFVKALASCDTPMVAAVEGAAVGIGTTLVFHCDLAYAAPDAKFRTPFVDLALVPEAGSSLLMPKLFGPAKAAEFLMLGDAFDAGEAHRLGLINDVVAPEKLHDRALEQATRLAAKPRAALAATRKLLRGDRAEVLARIDEEARLFARAMLSQDAQKAFQAFLARSASKP